MLKSNAISHTTRFTDSPRTNVRDSDSEWLTVITLQSPSFIQHSNYPGRLAGWDETSPEDISMYCFVTDSTETKMIHTNITAFWTATNHVDGYTLTDVKK